MAKLHSSSSISSSLVEKWFDPSPLVPGKDYAFDPACPDCVTNSNNLVSSSSSSSEKTTTSTTTRQHLISGGSPVLALHAWKYRVKVKVDGGNNDIDEEVVTDEPAWVH